MENHSIAKTIEMWRCSEINMDILSGCSDDDKRYINKYFSEVILYTDPSNHGSLVENMTKVVTDRINNGIIAFDSSKEEDRILLGGMIAHASDISATAHVHFEVAKDWTQRVTSEFRIQANLERNAGLVVTSYMDGLESEVKVAKMQIDFCRFMVLPLIKVLVLILPKAAVLQEGLLQNIEGYKNIVATGGASSSLGALHINNS
mmetsp:Transcript_24362/g.29970  ORF Transcript_24362/g.29970 Transcript_24362/m.29970 type:complete len:204 (+) Transcript_24362:643-1254(+)